MNPLLNPLQPYPFARLHDAMQDLNAPENLAVVALHIGEPKHPTPTVITAALATALHELANYPTTVGLPELRQACADWANRRYQGLTLDSHTEVLPVLGTREALFAFAQVVLGPNKDGSKPVVISPNPFYQIYEGAALLAGADIELVNCHAPDFLPAWSEQPEEIWQRTQLVFVCSPNNPSGSVMQLQDWAELFALQDRYGFIIASDECYSEIYFDEKTKPASLLEASLLVGNESFKNILVMNSISKRSSAPGLRSGFIAGDEQILKEYLQYRTYVGCASPVPLQEAAAVAWNDQEHVAGFRKIYKKNFEIANEILGTPIPDATFYIWLEVEDELEFTRNLYKEKNVKVLPGSFLGRNGLGKGYIRIALVENEIKTRDVLTRLKDFIDG